MTTPHSGISEPLKCMADTYAGLIFFSTLMSPIDHNDQTWLFKTKTPNQQQLYRAEEGGSLMLHTYIHTQRQKRLEIL